MHAGWNALLKVKLEPLMSMTLIHAFGVLIALPVLVYTGMPKTESLIWLLASTIIHLGYYYALAAAYDRADMGQVYPIARGSAPLMTGLIAVMVFGETLTLLGGLGIVLLATGIFVMSLKSAADAAHMDRKALLFAGMTAITITLYTLSDGIGARVSGDALAYTAALFVFDGLAIVTCVYFTHGWRAFIPMRDFLPQGLAGGAMACGSYGIAIWAMTVAPIPLVAAVRESSVLFGAIIAVVFLKEPLRTNRIVAAVLIVAGLIAIRMQTL